MTKLKKSNEEKEGVLFTLQEVELLKKKFGFEINKKMKGTAWIISKAEKEGKDLENKEKLLKNVELYKDILKKIGYEEQEQLKGGY